VRRLLWIALAVLAIGFVVLSLQHNDGLVAELARRYHEATLETKIIALVFIAIIAAAALRQRLTNVLGSALVWAAIVLALALGYTYRFELRDVADRVMSEFIPGRPASKGRTVELARGSGGSFAVNTQVNGARVAMVLDTGASAVVLTHEAAKAAGLPLEVLNYSVSVETANGRTRAAPVTLDRVTVGNITERSVAALIAQPGALRTNLLGMSFLNRLQSWEVRGDRLIMRGYP